MTSREEEANKKLQKIASYIKSELPEGMGFALLAFEFGDAKDRQMLYISNADRSDIKDAMTEWLNKVDDKSYGKHIGNGKKTWYSIEELLEQNLDNNKMIWCLNSYDFRDFVTSIGQLKEATQDASIVWNAWQFAIVSED